jgi:hypothetical protein
MVWDRTGGLSDTIETPAPDLPLLTLLRATAKPAFCSRRRVAVPSNVGRHEGELACADQ